MQLNQYSWDPINDLIAEGAFAEVFRAKDNNTLGRKVALKVYKEAVAKGTAGSSGQKKYTLEKEFGKVDGLSHTNIISYYGLHYMKNPDALGRMSSYPVIIMEYASEGTLKDFMSSNPTSGEIKKVIVDIIKGVAYLHSEGIIHRDLKPGNILITKNRKGEPVAKITDFGISRDILTEQTLEQSMTSGVGTPHHMAPEQFFKKKFGLNGELSEQTDIWAVGVIIYWLLTGKLPFGNGQNDYEEVRNAIVAEEYLMEGLDGSYAKVIENCLQKDAGKRCGNVLDLLSFIDDPDHEIATKPRTQEKSEAYSASGSENNLLTEVQGSYHNLSDNKSGHSSKNNTTIVLATIFSMINLLGIAGSVLNRNRETEGTSEVWDELWVILYSVCAVVSFWPVFRPKFSPGLWQYLSLGLVTAVSITIGAVLSLSIDFQAPNSKSLLSVLYVIVFHSGFFLWLGLSYYRNTSLSIPWGVVLGFIGIHIITYYLPLIDESASNVFIVMVLFSKGSFTYLPNVFVLAILFICCGSEITKYRKWVIGMASISVVLMSLWWLLLDPVSNYSIKLFKLWDTSGSIQDLNFAYYIWYLSIYSFLSFAVKRSIEGSAWERYYWPALIGISTALLVIFINNASKAI